MAEPLPEVPVNFRPIQHYLKTAAEHDKRDPVVAYYCRLFAMQRGMEIDKKSADCRNYLRILMNLLEQTKKQLKDNEAIQSEVVGHVHLENYAIKLFFYADTEDRAGRFGKNVVKSFYTAGMLMDVLSTFGELSEDIEKNRKYAKWKAAYIHNCLKNGEVPHPGPLPDGMGEIGNDEEFGGMGGSDGFQLGGPSSNSAGPSGTHPEPMDSYPNQPSEPSPAPRSGHYPMNQPINKVLPNSPAVFPPGNQGAYPPANPDVYPPANSGSYPPANPGSYPPANPGTYPSANPVVAPSSAVPVRNQPEPAPRQFPSTPELGVKLRPEDFTKAMKFCKFASSALQYEDAKTAIDNLHKALKLLTTGKE